MNLNKRLIFLLLPVILFGYGLSTYFVYQYQKSNIFKLEQAKLEQRMFKLQSVFKEEASVVDNLMALFLEGRYLSDFLLSAPSDYRHSALGQNLSLLISQSLINKSSPISFAVFSGDGAELFYYERSSEPFDKISAVQKEMSIEMINNRVITEWKFFHRGSDFNVVAGRLLDSVALLPFKGRDINNSVQLSFSISMDQFYEELLDLTSFYKAEVIWTDRSPPSEHELSYSIQFSPGQILTVRPDKAILDKPLFAFFSKLTFIAICLGLFTYLLLVYLISRFITAPISQLDNELDLVISYKKDNISPTPNKSEVGKLSKKFFDLFEQLQNNLKSTHEMAITDALTALPNRFRFYEYAKHILVRAEENGALVSFVYIDIDNFKFVNDKLGHEAGDELLFFLARDLHKLIEKQPDCMVSRLSGDEFAIVMTHLEPVEVDELALSIVALFDGGYESDNYYFPVSASMGIASFPNDGVSLNELIANADMAMYHAKRSGKNQYKHYSTSIATQARRLKIIENHLKTANCENEFFLVYMPYTCSKDQVKGFEVLIRWHSSELGVIDPDEFIPIAEQTGTYAKIDNWVFETAFKSLPKIKAIFGESCVLSINISAAELSHHAVLDRLKELKEQYQIDDSSIELELTETFSYVQTDSVFEILNGMQSAGFNIVIDDFGVGYTPLLHLIDYPVNKVKLDKVLTERVTNPDYKKLLSPLIQLCHLQDIVVTAEGIECESQLQCLKEAGCDFFQGYLLSKPMVLDELEGWYKNYQPCITAQSKD